MTDHYCRFKGLIRLYLAQKFAWLSFWYCSVFDMSNRDFQIRWFWDNFIGKFILIDLSEFVENVPFDFLNIYFDVNDILFIIWFGLQLSHFQIYVAFFGQVKYFTLVELFSF